MIQMDRDWTALTEELAKFEPRVLAFNAESTEPSRSTIAAVNVSVQRMAGIEKTVNDLVREIDSFRGTAYTASALGGQIRCSAAETLKEKIGRHEAAVKAKEAELNRLIRAADDKAASCSTAADGSLIRTNYNKAIGLLGEIGVIEKLAVADSNELLLMSKEAELQKGMLKEVEDRVAKLGTEAKRADDTAQSAVRQYEAGLVLINGLPGKRGALRSEFDLLKKTYDVDQSLAILPLDLKKRITLISDILAVTASDSGKMQEAADTVARLKRIAADIVLTKQAAEKKLAGFKADMCQIDTMSSTVDQIGTAFTGATIDVAAAADLPRKADTCVNRAECQAMRGDLRAAINANDSGSAEALIVRMNGKGCDTSDLKAELDAKNERDAVNLINLSKQNCRFQQAVNLAAQIPASIRSWPRVAQAISEAEAGLKAQQRIDDLIDKADATSDLSDARSFIDEARRIAAPFSCLAESIRGKNVTVKQPDVEEIPEDSAPRTAGNDRRPTDRVPKREVEEIPDDPVTPVRPTPEKPSNSKPKNNGPGFWEKLGKVVADTAAGIQNGQNGGGQQNPPGPPPVQQGPPAAGSLPLTESWVKPSFVQAGPYGKNTYSYSATSATWQASFPPSEGGDMTLSWKFSGVPAGGLVPGQEYPITVTGTFTTSLAPRDFQPPASAGVRVIGLGYNGEKGFQQQNAYISKSAKRDGLYVFTVPMNATSITIELGADYGIGTFAIYKFGVVKK